MLDVTILSDILVKSDSLRQAIEDQSHNKDAVIFHQVSLSKDRNAQFSSSCRLGILSVPDLNTSLAAMVINKYHAIFYYVERASLINVNTLEQTLSKIAQIQKDKGTPLLPMVLMYDEPEDGTVPVIDRNALQEHYNVIDILPLSDANPHALNNKLVSLIRAHDFDTAAKELEDKLIALRLPKSILAAIHADLDNCKQQVLADDGPIDFTQWTTTYQSHLDTHEVDYYKPQSLELIILFLTKLIANLMILTTLLFCVGLMLGAWTGPMAFLLAVLSVHTMAQYTMLFAMLMALDNACSEINRLYYPNQQAKQFFVNFEAQMDKCFSSSTIRHFSDASRSLMAKLGMLNIPESTQVKIKAVLDNTRAELHSGTQLDVNTYKNAIFAILNTDASLYTYPSALRVIKDFVLVLVGGAYVTTVVVSGFGVMLGAWPSVQAFLTAAVTASSSAHTAAGAIAGLSVFASVHNVHTLFNPNFVAKNHVDAYIREVFIAKMTASN